MLRGYPRVLFNILIWNNLAKHFSAVLVNLFFSHFARCGFSDPFFAVIGEIILAVCATAFLAYDMFVFWYTALCARWHVLQLVLFLVQGEIHSQ